MLKTIYSHVPREEFMEYIWSTVEAETALIINPFQGNKMVCWKHSCILSLVKILGIEVNKTSSFLT